jgi:hypothetical protein
MLANARSRFYYTCANARPITAADRDLTAYLP